MTETLNNVENTEIKSLVEQMNKLDLEFDKKSSQLSEKLINIEKGIEELKNDKKLNEKYSSLIFELEQMLDDLRMDWNIDNIYTNNKILDKLNSISWTELFTQNKELFFKIYYNFNNPNIINSEIKQLFRQKFVEYAKTWGYEFKESAEIYTEILNVEWVWLRKSFHIDYKDLTKVPESYNLDLKTWLAGYFWD